MSDQIKQQMTNDSQQTKRGRGRPKGAKNRPKEAEQTRQQTKRGRGRPSKAAQALNLDRHVDSVLDEAQLPDTPTNRRMVGEQILNPGGFGLQQKGDKGFGETFRQGLNVASPRAMGRLATSQALDVARAEFKPLVELAALHKSGTAIDYLIGLVEGTQEAPASVRRLAALDVLQLGGIVKIGQGGHAVDPSHKGINEMSADELRALLDRQRAAMDALQAGLGPVVNA